MIQTPERLCTKRTIRGLTFYEPFMGRKETKMFFVLEITNTKQADGTIKTEKGVYN